MTRRDQIQVTYGMMVGLALAGCAGAALYPYYNMEIPDGCYQDGKLLAHDPKDDKDLSVCKPNADNKMPCIVRMSEDDERLRLDLDKCQKDLVACQQHVDSMVLK